MCRGGVLTTRCADGRAVCLQKSRLEQELVDQLAPARGELYGPTCCSVSCALPLTMVV